VTTRSIAQEQSESAVEAVQDVLQDDLYQDPVQVRIACLIFPWCCASLFN